jgi:hypothetical protein
MKGTPPRSAAASSVLSEVSISGSGDEVDDAGRGMDIGRWGLAVAEVGRGGIPRIFAVSPGMRRTTVFCTLREF